MYTMVEDKMAEDGNPWVKFTHIGVVVRDIGKAVDFYSAMGLGPFTRFRLPSDEFGHPKMVRHFGRDASDNVYEVAWGKFGDIAMELFQPIVGDSIPSRFLEAKGEGVWHYGYDVHSMDDTIAWMKSKGYEVVGESLTEDGVRMSYFNTNDLGGIYFQAHEVPATSEMYEKLGGKM